MQQYWSTFVMVEEAQWNYNSVIYKTNKYSRELGVGVCHKFMLNRCVILDHKNRYTIDLNHRWGALINYTENISTPVVEIEKKLHCKIIVSFTGIISM